jgi:septation ring formation regulator EzrA
MDCPILQLENANLKLVISQLESTIAEMQLRESNFVLQQVDMQKQMDELQDQLTQATATATATQLRLESAGRSVNSADCRSRSRQSATRILHHQVRASSHLGTAGIQPEILLTQPTARIARALRR